MLEGAVSNVFAVLDGVVVTPPLAAGILPGITRAWAIAACAELGFRCREAELRRDALVHATGIFLTNSIQEIVLLGGFEGRLFSLPPIGIALSERYRAAVLAARG